MLYGYTRVSTTEQASADKSSLAEQERRIRGAAMMRGSQDIEIYSDPGVSGSVLLSKRDAGARLLSVLAKGDIVIAAKLDRLFRSASDALTTVEELQRKGVGVILTDIGTDPVTENGVSKLFFSMLAAFAEFEKTRIAERMAEGRRGKALRGGHTGGAAPYGFVIVGKGREAILAEFESEQIIIAKMKAMAERGRRPVEIQKEINGIGYVTRDGKPFHPMQINRILKRVNQQTPEHTQ